MHSRIIQLNKNPILKREHITGADFYDHRFNGAIADYVSEDTDREEDIKWLLSTIGDGMIGSDELGVYLQITSKNKYFEPRYKDFMTSIETIKSCTLEEFIEDKIHYYWYTAETAYNDKFDMYIMTEKYGELLTITEFMRRCEVGVKYYIGGTLDYHY